MVNSDLTMLILLFLSPVDSLLAKQSEHTFVHPSNPQKSRFINTHLSLLGWVDEKERRRQVSSRWPRIG